MTSARPRLTFEGVWKRFRLGHAHDSLRDLIPGLAKKVLRRAAEPTSPKPKRFRDERT